MSIQNDKLMNLADGKVLYDDLRGRTDNLIAVQDATPTDEATKIWLTETPPSGVQVPTYAEHTAVASDVSAIKAWQPSGNGTLDQVMRSNGDGTTRWADAATSQEISSAVTSWLDDNVPTGTTVVVDKTLSIENAAAESKTVGSLKSALNTSLNATATELTFEIAIFTYEMLTDAEESDMPTGFTLGDWEYNGVAVKAGFTENSDMICVLG